MPLRIRLQSGDPILLDRPCIVEVVDEAGRLAAVLTQGAGSLIILTPDDPRFAHYVQTTQAAPANVHVHSP